MTEKINPVWKRAFWSIWSQSRSQGAPIATKTKFLVDTEAGLDNWRPAEVFRKNVQIWYKLGRIDEDLNKQPHS